MSTLNIVSEFRQRDIVVASSFQLKLPLAAYIIVALAWRQFKWGDLDIRIEVAGVETNNLRTDYMALLTLTPLPLFF